MFKIIKKFFVISLSLSTLFAMASINPNDIENKNNELKDIAYEISENGINIRGSFYDNSYNNGSKIYLYIFKDNLSLYYKYDTNLNDNKFSFNNLVFKKSDDYVSHYRGKNYFKLVINNSNGETYSKTYIIDNKDFLINKIDKEKNIAYKEANVKMIANENAGLKKDNNRLSNNYNKNINNNPSNINGSINTSRSNSDKINNPNTNRKEDLQKRIMEAKLKNKNIINSNPSTTLLNNNLDKPNIRDESANINPEKLLENFDGEIQADDIKTDVIDYGYKGNDTKDEEVDYKSYYKENYKSK